MGVYKDRKIKLLFVIDSLEVAGAEKSLVTLLNMLDYAKYSVDLQLFGYGGALESLIPNEVNLLPPLEYTKFTSLKMREAISFSLYKGKFRMLTSRMKYSLRIRKEKLSNPQKARAFWESVSKVIETNPETYDIAISYAQGVPTFYVASKIKAKKKFAWVNVSYRLDDYEKKFHKTFYDQFTKIVAVSNSAKDIFIETFPFYKEKIEVIYDINHPHFINKMANMTDGYDDHFSGIRILTIGRLAHQKGYDVALEACKKLKDLGIDFRWYVLGKGPLKGEIIKYIKESDLSDHFVLLGVTANPYPYIKQSDIYVQTSRFEGFGLAIAEARMLNIPVVTTKFDAVFNQMVDGKNGLVVERNADAVCEGITKLIHDKSLRNRIVEYLKQEKKGNVEEIDAFYQLIG